ncbi:uncharacterized protein HMPREF1541_01262 [Cyphellophora europaea CBS 101466]|uniref:Uncharacterized protein n=1 Tax=Cyphellophora europaea (strain CBS 101466) TaxID=1220924 RepID=W2SEF2_CYPE1|nr:uncharacterized protein HMPREF1541_01262 [Cyphellophora europaea CBS 101466]ETN47072.1 hypothetical protein HMPREF1541_01262 [Cyphellophora europaea CBS 101466]
MAHRTITSKSAHCLGQRSPLHLRTAIARTRPTQLQQCRYLWWWSSKNNRGCSSDGFEDDRYLRLQRFMRHRDAKIVRRRAMWDRDEVSDAWPWQRRRLGRRFPGIQNLSSDDAPQPVNEKRSEPEQDELTTFRKEFNSFKQAIDRAIERDPYQTLFGRRLWSPPSANNSSWTSFSWVFDPKETKSVNEVQADSSPKSTAAPSRVPEAEVAAAEPEPSRPSPAAAEPMEYDYDPITMRKVPRVAYPFTAALEETPKVLKKAPTQSAKAAPEEPAIEPRRTSIFETLFGENAVDIPVKTYSPKVYGYGEISAQKPSASTPKRKPGFENSRQLKFQSLKATTLGNTIDTTAEYGGKYVPPGAENISDTTAEPKHPSELVAVEQLSSSTTPEAQANDITTQPQHKSSDSSTQNQVPWLAREGFVEESSKVAGSDLPAFKNKTLHDGTTDIPIKGFNKFKSSSDWDRTVPTSRMQKLQPSLDRSTHATKTAFSKSPKEEDWQGRVAAAEKAEDIDLLRSSDVRAAMKAKRATKQDMESRRRQKREQLEQDFASRHNLETEVDKPIRPQRPEVRHVWKHVESNPDGIVARTMKSMGALYDNFRNDVRGITNLQNPPSSQEASRDRSLAVDSTQKPLPPAAVLPRHLMNASQPHPLSTASVKEGVSRSPAIEKYVSNFEPAYSRLVYDMKAVRRELHDIKLHVKDLRMKSEKRPWKELEAERLAEYAKEPLVEEDASASGLDEPVFTEAKKVNEEVVESLDQPVAAIVEGIKRDTDPRGLDEPVTAYPAIVKDDAKMAADLRAQTDLPRTMEDPVFTPSGSAVWNDEQPPPLQELKAASAEYTSPVVTLAYNHMTEAVEHIPSQSLPEAATRAKNPFTLLAGLDQAKTTSFLEYFPKLQDAGYELVDGGKDKLVFSLPTASVTASATTKIAAPTPALETAAKEAATVLNEIPTEVDPPGPSAPIPPPTSIRQSSRLPKSRPRVKRQEEVFSGTTTAPAVPLSSAPKRSSPSPIPPTSDASYDYATPASKDGFFSRVARGIRTVTLTVLALAGGAYMIGFIAEGIGAQAQAQRGINQGGNEVGPRKKMVLPVEEGEGWKRGTRPGIYSTESSRRE